MDYESLQSSLAGIKKSKLEIFLNCRKTRPFYEKLVHQAFKVITDHSNFFRKNEKLILLKKSLLESLKIPILVASVIH